MLEALSDKLSVEIEGTSEDLRQLSQSIRTCSESCNMGLSMPAVMDNRGLRYLRKIEIRVTSDSLQISELDQSLFLVGGKEKLDLLADNIDWLVSSTDGTAGRRDHLHIEFYPGHFFLSENALPLVVVRQD